MSLATPELIRTLRRKLYGKAKARRQKLPTRGSRQFSKDAVFGPLGVPRLRFCRRPGVLS